MNSDNYGIRINDIPEELRNSTGRILRNYFCFILRIKGKGTSEEQPKLLGSGTLIKVGEFHGILTAEHISCEFKEFDEMGISYTFNPTTASSGNIIAKFNGLSDVTGTVVVAPGTLC